jgi:hypothetical protein
MGMLRRLLLPLLAFALLLTVLHRQAAAQGYYAAFGSGTINYVPSADGLFLIPQAPRATYDKRIDPHLVKASRIADTNAFPHTHLRCWQYVKNALLQAGAVGARPSTSYACQAGSELTSRYGFVRLPIRDPYRAPIGAVLVYQGGGAGHVEIRTAHGFASDYRSVWACRYRLIGVYAKISA